MQFSKQAFSVEHSELFNSFSAGVSVFPHHAKKHKGGEDAFFLSNSFIAVADGVGGWAESGVDPAIYSRNLCLNIGKLV